MWSPGNGYNNGQYTNDADQTGNVPIAYCPTSGMQCASCAVPSDLEESNRGRRLENGEDNTTSANFTNV